MEIKELFPYMVVINLPDRIDRREAFLAATQRLGFEVDIIHPKTAAELGMPEGRRAKQISLAEAEIEAVSRAKNKGVCGVLIFEDDAVFHEHILLMTAQMTMPEDWQLFYFGCQHHETPKYVSLGIVRCFKSNDTHALGIRDTAFDKIIATLRDPNRLPCCDMALRELQKSIPVYAAYPNLIWQRENYSDIEGRIRGSYFPTGEQKGWKNCPPPQIP